MTERSTRVRGLALLLAMMLITWSTRGAGEAQTVEWSALLNGISFDSDSSPGSGNQVTGKRALAVGGSGTVYVTGKSFNRLDYGYLTVAYDDAGNEIWTAVKDRVGATNFEDSACALALDAEENVYVTGNSTGPFSLTGTILTVAYDSAGRELWSREWGDGASLRAFANSIAVDLSGNVFVTGLVVNGADYDFLTVAYDSSGTELWAKAKDGPASGSDEALALAIGSHGAIFVTGRSGDGQVDFMTVAYDMAGNELWTKLKDGPEGGADYPASLAVDAGGNVYVTGSATTFVTSDYFTVAYDSSGSELWAEVKDGSGAGHDGAYAVAVDALGIAYVTGSSDNGSSRDFLTVAYGEGGKELWSRVKDGDGSSHDYALAIAVGVNGHVHVSGRTASDFLFDYLTVAYDSGGTELWARVLNGEVDGDDGAYALATDGEGNVYITGTSDDGPDSDFLTAAYDNAGNLLWDAREPSIVRGNDLPSGSSALAVDVAGNVYVAGATFNGSNDDFLLVAYDTHGKELWRRTINGSADGTDVATALIVTGEGTIVVTGESSNGSNRDILTAAYDSAGNGLWSVVRNGASNGTDRAADIAIDGSGNVYVTGSSLVGGTDDYLTVAYDRFGTERWARTRNGAGDGSDVASAVLVTEGGSVVVTGLSWDGGAFDAHTVAYDSAGNELWKKTVSGAGNGSAGGGSLAAGENGSVYLTGHSWNGLNQDLFTMNLDEAGNELWLRHKDGSSNLSDLPSDLAVDENGTVYVTGRTETGLDHDFLTVAYDSSGNELWAREWAGVVNGADLPRALMVGAGGSLFVTGTSWNGLHSDFLTLAYDSSGNELWAMRLDAGKDDYAAAMVSDGAGGMIVTGHSWRYLDSDVLTARITNLLDPPVLLSDDFELGDTCLWSVTVGGASCP